MRRTYQDCTYWSNWLYQAGNTCSADVSMTLPASWHSLLPQNTF